jgi:hypothetical protein
VKSVVMGIWCSWVLEAIEIPVCLFSLSIDVP